jgi:hypothetical protein
MVVTLSVITVGDRTFETSEVNALLQTLTASPKSTWLSSGTIRAQYLEFRVGEETAYESEELFRFDGQRFYWEILLMDPPAESAAPAVERPDHQTNKHRIFTYDGNAYTRYYKSADYAVVVMNQQEVPVNCSVLSAQGLFVGFWVVYVQQSACPQSESCGISGKRSFPCPADADGYDS